VSQPLPDEAAPPIVLSEGRRIARNSALLGLGDVANLVLGLATTVLITDRLGDDYGILLGAQRFVALFLVVAQFGLYPLLVRSVAARPHEAGALLGTVLALRAMLGGIFVLVTVSAAIGTAYLPEFRWLIGALVAVELVGIFTESHVAVCEGLERMGSAALVTVVRPVVLFAGLAAVVTLDLGLPGIAGSYAAARAAQLVLAAALVWRVRPPRSLSVRTDWMLPMLREALLFVLIGLAFTAMSSMDVVVLTRLGPTEAVSWYGGALNFFDVLLALPVLVQRSLLPAFTRLGVERRASDVARATLQVFSAVLLPASIGLAAVAREAVALYPSGAFGPSEPALRVLTLGVPFAGLALACAIYLTGVGRLADILRCYAVALPVELAVLLLSVPELGAAGAAAGRVAAHAVLAIALLHQVRNNAVSVPIGPLCRHAAASLAMLGVLLAVDGLHLAARVAIGCAVYAALMLALSGRGSLERALVAELSSLARSGWASLRAHART